MPSDLATLYDTYAGTLHAFLLGMTRHEADARDVLQAVFLRLAREPETLHGVRDPRAFLLRMAHRQFIDLTRRRAARETQSSRRVRSGSKGAQRTSTPASLRRVLTYSDELML